MDGFIPPTPPPAAKPPAAPAPQQSTVEGSVKDTIESILVAFMLAFIFRAFVVEAFVIPTGSMAPTLLGAHMRFRCPDCGYHFDANFQGTNVGPDDIYIPASAGANRVFAIICPNCGYRLPRNNPDDPQNDGTDPAVRYGDRILVLKYLYLFQEPTRWDVVVFKSPVDPQINDYQQNYIKRLVGLPGETVMVLDGDVYIGKGDNPETFEVQSKPAKVQDALWRIVSDSDYHPRGLDRSTTISLRGNRTGSDVSWQQPWKPAGNEGGWTAPDGKKRTFEFSNPTGAATLHFDADANPLKFALTDWLAYDATDGQSPPDRPDTFDLAPLQPDANVSDVKLDFYYLRKSGDGALRARVTKYRRVIEAAINQTSAMLLLDGKVIGQSVSLPNGSAPIHCELINVDYRASLVINGKEVAATTRADYAPDIHSLLEAFQSNTLLPKPTIQITAEQQACEISHLSLWRDIYYRNTTRGGQPLQWATPNRLPEHLMKLDKDQFFVLGDNSQVSLDARYWDHDIQLPHEQLSVPAGRVPRRFMLGKAFFVYWPAGFRPIDSAPALAPDFGDMRFIH